MSPCFTVCKKSRNDALTLEKEREATVLEIKHFSKRKTYYLVVSSFEKHRKHLKYTQSQLLGSKRM